MKQLFITATLILALCYCTPAKLSTKEISIIKMSNKETAIKYIADKFPKIKIFTDRDSYILMSGAEVYRLSQGEFIQLKQLK